jgi:hypothetical protein
MTSMLDQGVNMVKPALDASGPNVYIIQTIRQPLSTDSSMGGRGDRDQGTRGTVANTLSFYAGMLKGMVDPREFEGNTIYTSEMMGMSAGLGFGHLFIGQTPAVENAMRWPVAPMPPKSALSRASRTRLDLSEPTAACSRSPTSLRRSARPTGHCRNADKEYEKQLEDYGLDAERKDEIMKRFRENQPKWRDKLPPIDTILQHVGNTASEVRPTPDGFPRSPAPAQADSEVGAEPRPISKALISRWMPADRRIPATMKATTAPAAAMPCCALNAWSSISRTFDISSEPAPITTGMMHRVPMTAGRKSGGPVRARTTPRTRR